MGYSLNVANSSFFLAFLFLLLFLFCLFVFKIEFLYAVLAFLELTQAGLEL